MKALPDTIMGICAETMEIAYFVGIIRDFAPTHTITDETMILLEKVREMIRLAKDSLEEIGPRGSLH